MKRVVEEQQLGFVATVCPDGTPLVSPSYDDGPSEAQVSAEWRDHWETLWGTRG
jgi:hypothetical protein